MKKIFLTAGIFLSTFSFAQFGLSSTRFGVTGGYNYSRVRHAHNPSGPRHTLQGGVMALFPVSNDDQFYIQPEVVYYGAGETGRNKLVQNQSGYNAVYGNSYISVPVYFKGYFSEAESEFFAMVGPRVNFLIGQKIKDPAKADYTVDGVTYPDGVNVNGKASSVTAMLGGGVGFSYKRKLELALRADLGLSNVYKGLMNEKVPGDPNVQRKKKENVVGVTLSYIFD